jgi:hypothetical protein
MAFHGRVHVTAGRPWPCAGDAHAYQKCAAVGPLDAKRAKDLADEARAKTVEIFKAANPRSERGRATGAPSPPAYRARGP